MKRAICLALSLSLLLCFGCAPRVVPEYPKTDVAVKAVAESNMPPEQKPISIAKIQETAVVMYDKAVEAWQKQGSNWVEIAQIVVGMLTAGATFYFGARVSK